MTGLEQGLPEPPGESSPSEDEDGALLAALLRKDRKATAEFVSRYSDSVYAFVRYRLAPQYDVVDDLVQEVFLAAWEGIGQFRRDGSLEGWLMGIARHKVEDYYRARLRAPEPLTETGLELVAGNTTPEFDARLDQEQARNKTWQVMAELSEQYRLVLIWRYWEKVSAREMAVRVGKTEKAIERLLARAREQFRDRWNHV
ncbi:MAG: RNA polymerase sigma factor [Terriglobales bacterium]